MLVLTLRSNDCLIIGDLIIVTVEAILGPDGRYLRRGTVRLGVEAPRSVAIRRKRIIDSPSKKRGGPPPRIRGEIIQVADARVRLSISVPARVPVHWNGTSVPPVTSETLTNDDEDSLASVHRVTCEYDDRVTICYNITMAVQECQQFVKHQVKLRCRGTEASCRVALKLDNDFQHSAQDGCVV